MKSRKAPSIYTAVRIPPKLRKDAEKRAAKQGRTLSNYIKNLIREDLDEGHAGANYHTEKKTKRSSG
jgi:predicted HicB family RNase H-like nuclease